MNPIANGTLRAKHISCLFFFSLDSLQGGNITGGGQMLMMDWNSRRETIRDAPQKVEVEKSMMKMYNGDWMMVLDMDPSEFCSAKPLKTLELFPTTSTNLQEDCKNSTVEPV